MGALAPSDPGPRLPPPVDPTTDAGATPGAARPDLAIPGGAPTRRQLLGVRTQPVTAEIRRRLNLPVANGAWVVSRTLGSAAEKAGIPLDAVITAVDKTLITSPQDLSRQVSLAGAGHSIALTYFSEGEYHRANVTLADIAGPASAAAPGSPAAEPPATDPGPTGQGPNSADAAPELPAPTAPRATPPVPDALPGAAPPGAVPPEAPADGRAQPFPPKSAQAQIRDLQRRLDELDQRVRQLEQAPRH